jgi:hypothetical protein
MVKTYQNGAGRLHVAMSLGFPMAGWRVPEGRTRHSMAFSGLPQKISRPLTRLGACGCRVLLCRTRALAFRLSNQLGHLGIRTYRLDHNDVARLKKGLGGRMQLFAAFD